MALPLVPLPPVCVYIGQEEPEPQRRPSRGPSRRRRRRPLSVLTGPRSGSPGMKGPSLEMQMVEDEAETTSEELPPHLQEEPPEVTVRKLDGSCLFRSSLSPSQY